jgi:hypothetical protein
MVNAGAIDTATAANADGSLEEFYVDNNDSMFYRYQESPSTDGWSNEERIAANLER